MFRREKSAKNDGRIRLQLDITRQKNKDEAPYLQSVVYETGEADETVARALQKINEAGDYKDVNGAAVGTIRWENSCFQKKCGACAMVIDGRPALACAFFLKDHKGSKPLSIKPLSKFPVIEDLAVDRGILFENLKVFGMWASGDADLDEKKSAYAYEASKCLQCGCCLEVCPNYAPGLEFFGASGFVPASRLLSALPEEELKRVKDAYMKHEYKGCAKSLACMNICPAGIDIEALLINSNAVTRFKT